MREPTRLRFLGAVLAGTLLLGLLPGFAPAVVAAPGDADPDIFLEELTAAARGAQADPDVYMSEIASVLRSSTDRDDVARSLGERIRGDLIEPHPSRSAIEAHAGLHSWLATLAYLRDVFLGFRP
jgi:hypothetical protein